MKNYKIFTTLFFLLSICFATTLLADIQSPTVMLQDMSAKALAQLKAAKVKVGANQQVSVSEVHRIIDEELLPNIDLNEMSRSVLGRNTWQSASVSQQQQFKAQFTDLVINTYAAALRSFDKSTMKFYPVRGGYQGKSIVQVNSLVNTPGAPPLPVVYHVQNSNGKWLIYDFSVDGISLVESYKAQFSPVVQAKGLSSLINTLDQHNKMLAAKQA